MQARLDEAKEQLTQAMVMQQLRSVTDTCFELCVPSPGTSLSSSETSCITKCTDRYMESWNLIATAVSKQQ